MKLRLPDGTELMVRLPARAMGAKKLDSLINKVERLELFARECLSEGNDDLAITKLREIIDYTRKARSIVKKWMSNADLKGFEQTSLGSGITSEPLILIRGLLTKKAIILAKVFGDTLHNKSLIKDIRSVLEALNVHSGQDQKEVIDIACNVLRASRLPYQHHFREFQQVLWRIECINDSEKYCDKTISEWVDHFKNKLANALKAKPDQVQKISRSIAEVKQVVNASKEKPACDIKPTVSPVFVDVIKQPVQVKKSNLVEDIGKVLKQNPEGLKGFIKECVEAEVSPEEILDYAKIIVQSDIDLYKPVLLVLMSYLGVTDEEKIANLTNFLGEINNNTEIIESYNPLTRSELLNIVEDLNEYCGHAFITDVASGEHNETDRLVLKVYEEQLQFSKSSYDDFLVNLAQNNLFQSKDITQKEIKDRLELKIGLDINDFYIIRAYRKACKELGGYKTNVDLQKILPRIEVQLDPDVKSEVLDLELRVKNLRNFFPELLGHERIEEPNSVSQPNSQDVRKVIDIKCPILEELGFEQGTYPTPGEVYSAYKRHSDFDRASDIYHKFISRARRLVIQITYENNLTEEIHVNRHEYKELCEKFKKDKE